jgi:MTH538 TIR-like domain (DUF1863).
MTQFDELHKALFGNPAPIRPQSSGLAGFLRTTQPQPKPLVKFAKPKVFVSFDYDNDVHYKRLLEAWSANSRFQFTFHDKTPQEIQSNDIGRIKAVLTTKVQEASHVLVLVGKHANQQHVDSFRIGCKSWIHFECQQAILYKKKIVAVHLEPNNELPTILNGIEGQEVFGFSQEYIMKALSK